jgi:alcohol dehydrogenase
MIQPFSIARLPRIEFGARAIAKLPGLIAQYGKRVLLVTGQRSFVDSPHWPALVVALEKAGIGWEQTGVDDEPSPQLVDAAVRQFHGQGITVVAGIGGGLLQLATFWRPKSVASN